MSRTEQDRRAAVQRGCEAEDYVTGLYLEQGFSVLARNLRIGGAELDLIVARDGDLRFVEVKARSPGGTTGVQAVDGDKRRRLVRGARSFLQHYDDLFDTCQFDVIDVRFTELGLRATVPEHAFDAD